jgi:organic radical activating enzyme
MKEKTLRYSEIFYSHQGEGKFVGVPSVFLRTFGCNFRCKKFGRDKDEDVGKYNPEVIPIIDALDTYKHFDELPIVHTGCDTYASIYPEFKRFMQNDTVDELVESLLAATPNGEWTLENGQDIHLVITGGEPLLGWQRFYAELLSHPRMAELKNLTFETNTTQLLRPEFVTYLQNRRDDLHVTWSCSPKLSVSGEAWEDAIKPDVAMQYFQIPNSNLYFKFVIANNDDVDEVESAVQEYSQRGVKVPVYVMPVGGRSEEYKLNESAVAEISLQKGWRFSPRLHISLYGNSWGT